MDFVIEGASYNCVFSRIHIFDLWCKEKGTNAEKMQGINNLLALNIKSKGYEVNTIDLKKCIQYICKKIVAFWIQYKRIRSLVVQYQSEWLKTKEFIVLKPTGSAQQIDLSSSRGRPKMDFVESSKRTKRRRIALLQKHDESAASVLRSSDSQSSLNATEINIEKVLSLVVDIGLSKHQYLVIRSFINSEVSYNLLPRYEKILKFKTLRYPNNIVVDETHAEVELQSLLDNTASSILELQKSLIEERLDETEKTLTLIGKWGFDGSTGHSEYKQKFSNCINDEKSLFVT
ncbi:uncharacterized protein LOC129237075 [Anastrepha obliqua]|uniref:uncharacterized protein LOC129237075 n=1 Tax=Anastrepha obliqua TaxID=95512 RepID=UPI002409CD5A|nr:uncharacterized protein LOC129237075 [Anastrepha obliqua]